MTTPCIKITRVKMDIRQIIENLNRLENCNINQYNLLELKCETDKLLSDLESMPLGGLKRKLKKQQRNRHFKNLQKAKIKEQNNLRIETDFEVATCPSKFIETSKNTATKPKPHHQLKSLQECQRFLKT